MRSTQPAMHLLLGASLLLGTLTSCGERAAPPTREEVISKTMASVTAAASDYAAALEEFFEHEALKPFLEVFDSQGLVRLEDSDQASGPTDVPPAGDGAMVVLDKSFEDEAKSATDALAEYLETKAFTEANVEAVNGGTVTFLLDASAFCFAGWGDDPVQPETLPKPVPEAPPVPGDEPAPDAPPPVPSDGDPPPAPRPEEPASPSADEGCLEPLDVEVRVDASQDGDAMVLSIRVNDGGHVVVFRLAPERITMTVDLAEIKRAYDSYAKTQTEAPGVALERASGKIELALDRPAVGDRRASISVVQDVAVTIKLEGDNAIDISVKKVLPLISARITKEEVDFDLSSEGASLALPLSLIFEQMIDGVTVPQSLITAGKTSFSLKLRKDRLAEIDLGESGLSWKVDNQAIAEVASAALSVSCSQLPNVDRALCTFDPGVDGQLKLAFSQLETYVQEQFPTALNEIYRVALTGDAPQVAFGEGESVLEVVRGRLLLEQTNTPLQVAVEAGQCLLENPNDEAIGFDNLMAGQCL